MNRESLAALMRSPKIQFSAAAVTSLVAGAATGFVIGTRRARAASEAELEFEIDKAKEFYKSLYSSLQKPASPQEMVTQIQGEEALLRYKGHPVLEGLEVKELSLDAEPNAFGGTIELVEQNAFEENDNEDPDLPEDAMPDRDPDNPYVITQEEYMENELEYEQNSMSYFAGDGVLVDSREVPVDASDEYVGDDNLEKFGLGSNDKNVVYIRNEKLEMDFEIVRSEGEYTAEVLGLQHSDEPRQRRFRHSDE